MLPFITKATCLLLLAAGVQALADRSASSSPPVFRSTPIQNHFIVQYRDDLDPVARQAHQTQVHAIARASGRYQGVIRNFAIGTFSGFHGELDAQQVAALNRSTLIKRIQPDATVRISSPLHVRDTSGAADLSNIRTVQTATWGQARISHRLPNANSFVYEKGGATAYIIDTGILVTHSEFGGGPQGSQRAVWGANFVNTVDTDEDGHGTHVAGTVGGLTYGIAPKTRLVALKVFDGNGYGTWSGILSAISWASNETDARGGGSLSVINLSLGGDYNAVINDAVSAAVLHHNITVVTAAGNENRNTSAVSPASCPDAIAVGATDSTDTRASFSNWGPAMAVFAPGVDILSSWITNANATARLTGTSQASPHVAGLAAYFMGLDGPHTPAEMRRRIVGFATLGRVQNAGQGSPNRIAFNGNALEVNRV
ncbi:peptidase S8/S53 domain-containing protein [Cercophora scortea]|uniref:Peptidase S8/S53 domain-containing protein n=1 Tax=Cercophora scortea TaxID=314031 RepID=A0AAE0J426_9PEZI|nr:peptidase S8/S53 domain-containing protein [Cercophora scortea]